jgi:hypothetical protein
VPTIQPPEVRQADKLASTLALPGIRLAALLGMLATAALLGVVSATAGLGTAGWVTGLVTGSAAAALLVTARRRGGQPAVLPADWVTLTRMLMIAGVTALAADSFSRPVSSTALVTLSAAASGVTSRRAVRIAVLAPDQLGQFSIGAFVRIPVELLVLVAAPLEPMDAFRNQFLNTFSSKTAAQDASAQGSNETRTAAVSGASRR